MSVPSDSVSYTTKELLAEIREGIHGIKSSLAAHDMRIFNLESRQSEQERLANKYIPAFEELSSSVTIQNQVNEALEARNVRGFNKREKLIGLAFAVITTSLNIMALGPDIINP